MWAWFKLYKPIAHRRKQFMATVQSLRAILFPLKSGETLSHETLNNGMTP